MKQYLKQNFVPGKKTIIRWVMVLAAILIIIIAMSAYRFYLNSFDIYDFSHLTPIVDMGERSEFVPLYGSSVPNMLRAAENEYLALYVNPTNATIAVYDKRNSYTWFSSPLGGGPDPRANPFERNVMNSILAVQFYSDRGRVLTRWSHNDAVEHEQFEFYTIPNGLAIQFVLGSLDLGPNLMPTFIEAERFQTRILDQIEDDADRVWLSRNYSPSPDKEGFMRIAGIRQGVHAERAIRIFTEIGYTAEELEYDNYAAGYESEVTTHVIVAYIEFKLSGSDLIVNIPLRYFELPEIADLRSIEIMRFFGAAGLEDEGFILVPSGSGALIDFNNGKDGEEAFTAPIYGTDLLTTFTVPQNLQPVRLPIFGINKGHASMVVHIENGAALGTINANVSSRTNSFNHAWFNFLIRGSQEVRMGVPGNFALNRIDIVQSEAYEGDITIRYQFLSGDNITLGDMAATYRQFLIDRGDLTPITENRDRTFYLDIVGAADVRTTTLGVNHSALEVMTNIEQANHILDTLNAGGVYNVQMLLHGWFNRGINHDVATNINLIRPLGSQAQMQELNNRLNSSGGALVPAVNFTLTNFDSRDFNSTFEASRDIAGLTGIITTTARDLLVNRFSFYWNDWFFLVHPAVIPYHIDSFIPAFNSRVGLDSLALVDLGDFLTESMYRRNPVDREHSRLIAAEQIGRLSDELSNIIVFGGNDYAIAGASHLVDIPLRADLFYIVDHEVPFYQMVMHGFVEFTGAAVNIRPNPDPLQAMLTSMATGASPRFTMTATHTRLLQFSPHERMYSTYYANWVSTAIEHYRVFNDVYKNLLIENIIDFEILLSGIQGGVTVTTFSNGTQIYVNKTDTPFDTGEFIIPALGFYVAGGN